MRRYLDDEKINIARGLVTGATGIHINGSVAAMSQNQTGTIWDVNDTSYPWTALATANNLGITLSSASDVGNSITIYGLDANRDQITETVTLSATTGLTTSNTFKRINKVIFRDGGAYTQNVGTITLDNGNGTTVARIRIGNGSTQMAVYSVPRGKTAYILQGSSSIQVGADASGKMFIRQDGEQSFVLGHTYEVGGGGQYMYTFGVPFAAVANSDIDVRATVRSNNARMTAAFDLILVDDPQ